MRVYLILFDIDGTLVDTGGAGRRALLAAFDRLFRPASLSAAARVPFAGRTDVAIFRDLARKLGIGADDLAKKRVEFERVYGVALHRELHLEDAPPQCVLPGVLPLLEALGARPDARLGLLTGNIAIGARLKLERFDLDRFFEGGGFGDAAPDRRGVARAALEDMVRRTGVDFAASDVVVVGDTDNDVDCARANGFRAIAVDTGWAEPGSLTTARPDALFDDLSNTDAVLQAIFQL
jgi:phosphoglycolate phosphatase-like HAD superfamily hydrolase